MRTTEIMSVSLPPVLLRKIKALAGKVQMTTSEFLREAVRDYIRKMEWEEIRKYAARQAASAGLMTNGDVESAIADYRKVRH